MKSVYRIFIPMIVAIVALDQVTKHLVMRSIGFYDSVPVIRGYVDLVHVRNRGIAFGIFNNPESHLGSYILMAMTFAAVCFLLFWLFRTRAENRKTGYALTLIIAGALGNLIDRIRFLEVVDFLYVHVGGFHWPAFNVADSSITVGTISLAILLLLDNPKKESA